MLYYSVYRRRLKGGAGGRLKDTFPFKMDTSYKRTNETIQEFRKRVLAIQSAVNKRLKRLEEAGLTDTSTYRALKDRLPASEGGGVRFSIQGKKTNQELTRHYYDLMNTYNSMEGSIKGLRAKAKKISDYTGITFKGTDFQVRMQTSDFFRLADTISDYLKDLGQRAKALDYRRLHQAVSTVIQRDKVELAGIRENGKQLEKLLRNTLQELGSSYAEDTLDNLAQEFIRRGLKKK